MSVTTFTVNKANVYTEVAKTSSYSGKKKAADGSLYEQIFTTDEDRIMLERFWNDAANAITSLFKPFLVSVSSAAQSHGVNLAGNYVLQVELSKGYDSALDDSVQSSMFSYFVNYIVSQWYVFTNKDEAADFAKEAVNMLDDVKTKIYFRKKPKRVAPSA